MALVGNGRCPAQMAPLALVWENVTVLLSRGLDVVLRDLDAAGYDAIWGRGGGKKLLRTVPAGRSVASDLVEELRLFAQRHHRRLLAHVVQALRLAELEAEIQALIRAAEGQAERDLAEHRSRLRRGDERWGPPSRIAKWQERVLHDYQAERLRLAPASRKGRIRTLRGKIEPLRASGLS